MAGSGSGYIVALPYGGTTTTTYAGSYAGLLAAVTALGSSGGEIYIGPGTYTITSAITVNGPIRFVGGGWGAILQGTDIFNFSSGSSGSELTALRLNGSGTSGTGVTATQRLRVQNVLFSGTDTSHGFGTQVKLGYGSDGSVVSDCQFERVQGTSSTYSIFIDGAQNCRVVNSYFTSTQGLYGVAILGITGSANFNLVSGCQFFGYVGPHIWIAGSGTSYSAFYNRVQNCVSTTAVMSSATTSGAIKIGGLSADAAAYFYSCLNAIDSCTVFASNGIGVQVYHSKDNTLRNVIVASSYLHGISIEGSAATVVKDVTVYDPSSTNTNSYDGVNISNPTVAGQYQLSSNCVFENVSVKKSVSFSNSYRYAFNHVNSAGATQAAKLTFRDCEGTQGASGTFNNIPGDVRYAMVRTDDYAASTVNYHRVSGALNVTVPTGGTAVPLNVIGVSGSFAVDGQGDVSTSGSFVSSNANPIQLSYAGTSTIKATDAAGEIHLYNSSAAGTGLVINSDSSVSVGTSTPGGYKFAVSGTSNLTGTLRVTGAVTFNSSLFASTAVQTVTNNATSQTLTGGKLVLSNSAGTNLATLTGSATEGELVWLEATNGNTTVKDGTGNLYLAGDYAMTADDTMLLRYSSTKGGWEEVCRSGNI